MVISKLIVLFWSSQNCKISKEHTMGLKASDSDFSKKGNSR